MLEGGKPCPGCGKIVTISAHNCKELQELMEGEMMPNHHPTDEQKIISALEDAPTDLLEAELEKRKKQEFEQEIPKPVFATLQDFLPVVDLCQSYIGQLAEKEPYADDKLRQYVFEAAMEAVFGKEVWVWVKKRKSM